jgi:hypothetical protein
VELPVRVEAVVSDLNVLFHHKSFILKVIAKRHMTHKTIGPDAPRNSKPKALNSIGPVAYLKSRTTQIEAIAARGNPIVAAKCCLTTSTIQLLAPQEWRTMNARKTREKTPVPRKINHPAIARNLSSLR